MIKEARPHNVVKTVFSTSGAGKAGQPQVKKKKKKNESRSFPNPVHKNKLKMD